MLAGSTPQPLTVAQQRLSLTKIFITACTKLGMLSYGRTWSCGQRFAPRSAFLVPKWSWGLLSPFGNTSSLFSFSNKSLTHPSAASMGTLSVDSASATQAGKDFVQLCTPPGVPAGSGDPQ